MSGWIVLATYVAGFLFTYRRAYLALMTSEERAFGAQPDATDRAMTSAMAMLASMVWPATIIGWTVWRFATPTTPGQRKADLDQRQHEIERMERELGIDPERRPR